MVKGQTAWNKGLKGYMKGHRPYIQAKGKDNPFYGKKHSEETKELMRLKKLGKTGEMANNWKGGRQDLQRPRKARKYYVWRLKDLAKILTEAVPK